MPSPSWSSTRASSTSPAATSPGCSGSRARIASSPRSSSTRHAPGCAPPRRRLRATQVQVVATEAAIEAAQASIERVEVDIADSTLKAPRGGRVLYRLAEPGEVLGAGGKVLTLLDLSDVYMVIFLPATEAGRVPLGAQARLVLDAAPEYVVPAEVSFVAPRAQFTPKQVETRSVRETLAFRVKVRIDPELLARYEDLVKTGVPGVAYVQVRPEAPWPEHLTPRLPPWPSTPAVPPSD